MLIFRHKDGLYGHFATDMVIITQLAERSTGNSKKIVRSRDVQCNTKESP